MTKILYTPVTYYSSVTKTKPEAVKTLGDFLAEINNPNTVLSNLRNLKKTNPEKYNLEKSKLPGVSFGKFEKRGDKYLQEYSPILAFDIDNISSYKETLNLLSKTKDLDYVFCSFPSVSGLGLRILINTKSTKASHKEYYVFILELLENDLGGNCNIDKSTKNISRLWYYEPVLPIEFYLNEQSRTIELPKKRKKVNSLRKNDSKRDEVELTDIQAINLCHEIILSRNIEGRNNSLMQLAKLASEFGVGKDTIISVGLSYEDNSSDNPFPKDEILSVINKNILTSSRNFSQLLSYSNKILSAARVNKVIGKNQLIWKKPKSKSTNGSGGVKSNNKFIRILNFIQEKYQLRFNLISKELEIKDNTKSSFLEFNFEDLSCILFENGFSGFQTMLNSIVGSNKYRTEFNPLKEYLSDIPKWDETKPDYIDQLANYVKTDDQAWFRIQFKKMLVRSLACSLGYIEYNKQVFCLVGKTQNVGKTSFLRFLCPDLLKKYWQENLMLKDKDSLKALASNLFILFDEVKEFDYKELNIIKARISLSKVKMRLPFAKSEVTMDRIVNFFATTNQEDLLVDDQNVRWLVFKVHSINHDNGGDKGYNKNIDIDNVWAQAYYLLQSGFRYMLSNEEIKMSEDRNNDQFVRATQELELIQKTFIVGDKEDINSDFMTATDIKLALNNKHGQSLRLYSNKIGSALSKLGFEQTSKRINGKPLKGYWVLDPKKENDFEAF